MSHHTSLMLRIVPAPIKVRMKRWNCPQLSIAYGSPAVGRDSNTLDRVDARPVSRPCQKGLEEDSARKCGMNVARLLATAIASSPEPIPTCVCTPKMSSRRAVHWQESISRWYRGSGETV